MVLRLAPNQSVALGYQSVKAEGSESGTTRRAYGVQDHQQGRAGPARVVFGYMPVLDGRAAFWCFKQAERAGRAGLALFPSHTTFCKQHLSRSKIPSRSYFDLYSVLLLHRRVSSEPT